MRSPILFACLAIAGVASAAPDETPPPAQLQADVGLSVLGAAYERPLVDHLALQLEAQIYGTYFLPWFGAGDNSIGGGIQVRPTWFARTNERGLYVSVFGRADRVHVDRAGTTGEGWAASTGVVVGWAFRLATRLDLRLGAGVQYIWIGATALGSPPLGASTLFPTLDAVVGYRL
jgi:hypothetical protein